MSLGGAFIGESMFHRVSEGSKVALVWLVDRLRARGFELFDVQILNAHLARFGAYEVSEATYRARLRQALARPCRFS